jgi:mannitol 2-dehydrogenase
MKLNDNNLSLISDRIKIPEYDREKLETGIVHIGVGNFHRAHEAYYTDLILQSGIRDWGICGVGLLKGDYKMHKILTQQDGLYTLLEFGSSDAPSARVIGSIVDYLYGPEDPANVIERMSDPLIKIISLTITEGGYNFDSSTGEFNFSNPLIQWDLANPDHPKTVFGYLTQALKRRKEQNLHGVTLLSCDNIQQNGEVCKKMLLDYMKKAETGLVNWVRTNCTFPNSMVDRITPVTKPSAIDHIKTKYGFLDQWPVPCEPFVQWVIEDNFARGRPEWEMVGVQFVGDVEPYEKMKIRLLNAGHSLLGLSGTLLGYQTIDEAVQDELLSSLLRKFMDEEVTPVLGVIEGIDLEKYKESLIERFSNPFIKDDLSRICAETSAKMPKFLIPTIQEQINRRGSIQFGAAIIASWCRYLEMYNTNGYNYEVQDVMRDELLQRAKTSRIADPLAFLKIKSVFGNLSESSAFQEVYLPMIERLRRNGIVKLLSRLIS